MVADTVTILVAVADMVAVAVVVADAVRVAVGVVVGGAVGAVGTFAVRATVVVVVAVADHVDDGSVVTVMVGGAVAGADAVAVGGAVTVGVRIMTGDRPKLLDLFCGAGGAAKGYHDAGFNVVGIDINDQPRYPYTFHRADVFSILADNAVRIRGEFAAVHASPKCQRWTPMSHLHDVDHPDQITPLRPILDEIALPYVIENVPGSPLVNPIMLCGSMFDPPLDVRRHRLFEANWPLRQTDWPCRHKLWSPRFPAEDARMGRRGRMATVVGVYGGGRYPGSDAIRAKAMGIDWMRRDELTQAIPPVYTRFIGDQLIAHVCRGDGETCGTGGAQTHHEAWAEWSTHSVAVGASTETCFRAGFVRGVLAGTTVGRDPAEWRAAQLAAMAERDTHWRIWRSLTDRYAELAPLRAPERSFRAGFTSGQICGRRAHPDMPRVDGGTR